MKRHFSKISAVILLPLFLISSLITSILISPHTYADSATGLGGRSCPNFLGLTSWDCGLPSTIDSEAALKSNIWIIASNIAVDITIIAAYLVLGYVIYGGYLYIFSSGDPVKAADGKKTLTRAFIGLAIVMSANLIMGTIRIALVGGSGNIGNCATESGCVNPDDLIQNLINWFIAIAGIVSAIFLVYGGISYITSSGDPGKIQKAKQMIIYSLIGLAIVALSVAITAFVSNIIRESNNNAYINQSTISKEVNENKIY